MNQLVKDLRATHTNGQLAQLLYGAVSLVMLYKRFSKARSRVTAYRALTNDKN